MSPSDDLDDFVRQYKQEFAKSLPQKVNEIASRVKQLECHFDLNQLKELRIMIHKLGGTPAIIDYPKISQLCKAMDLQLQQSLSIHGAVKDDQVFQELNQFIQQLERLANEQKKA